MGKYFLILTDQSKLQIQADAVWEGTTNGHRYGEENIYVNI